MLHAHGRSEGKDADGNFHTRKLHQYPPQLREALANFIGCTLARFNKGGHGPRRLAQSGASGAYEQESV